MFSSTDFSVGLAIVFAQSDVHNPTRRVSERLLSNQYLKQVAQLLQRCDDAPVIHLVCGPVNNRSAENTTATAAELQRIIGLKWRVEPQPNAIGLASIALHIYAQYFPAPCATSPERRQSSFKRIDVYCDASFVDALNYLLSIALANVIPEEWPHLHAFDATGYTPDLKKECLSFLSAEELGDTVEDMEDLEDYARGEALLSQLSY